ncbi:MAG: N-acetylmuramoyl-L-alanine amidase [Aphanothece sp. CMT-3BRIN-NPC111]|nr:N-acetylmuramoyl-L-alanine amidase [Aphanothece sp. CMT-3BRIN-NPC111]
MKLNFLLLSCLSVFLFSLPAEAAKILSWRYDAAGQRLLFTTDARIQPKAVLMTNPTRLIIDLPGTNFDRQTVTQLYKGAIRSLRVGQFDNTTARLVIELAPGYTLDPKKVVVKGTTPQQWSVLLPTAQRDTTAQIGNPPGGETPPLSSVPLQIPRNAIPQEQLPNVNQKRILVIIDPGHGGKDSGAPGVGGILEKDIVLSISQQVTNLLEQQGVQVKMTRNSDYFVELAPRVTMTKQANANLFVSIHANSIDKRPDVNGLETYYYGSNSKRLAQTIQNSVLNNVNVASRGVRTARFYVLRNNNIPAVLVEVGFVTSPQEGPRLASADYQSQMASAIAQGILEYIQQNL